MSTVTSTPPVAPGSPELDELLSRIAAGSEERERNLTPPHEAIGWLKQAGLGRLRVPVADGGAGVSIRELFEVLIALAEADSNVAHIPRTHFWFVEQQVNNPDPEARARALALINSGALVGNGFSEQSSKPTGLLFDTTITPEEDGSGWRLNGAKFYSTGTLYSDYTQIWAAAPDGTIAGAVIPVDREGVTLEDDWDGFGQRLTGTGTTRLDNVKVSNEEYFDLGDPDQLDPGYQGAFLQLYLQAVGAGILRSVRNDAVALLKRRKRNFSHGPGAPTADPQLLQVIGEISADVFAAEAITLFAAEKLQAAADSVIDGVPDRDAALAAQRAAAEAKIAVDRFAYATAARLFDAGGASATQSVYNLDRHWRNVRTVSTHNPTFLKATAVGDFIVNGTAFPGNAYF